MDRYPKYKDSGIKWIGEIPKHWNMLPTKFLSTIVCGSTPNSKNPKFWDGEINWYTPTDLGNRENLKLLAPSNRKLSRSGLENLGKTVLTEANSLVLSTRAPVGKVGISTTTSTTNQGCKTLIVKNYIDVNYLYYYFSVSTDALNSVSNGTTFTELTTVSLSRFVVTTPSIIEQQKISEYLDKNSVYIDSLIERLERKIELLNEYRTALINQCVTKGLDATVELKDSGIEWIGEIPKHWNTKRLASLGIFFKGRSITNSDLTVSGNPCILYSQIYTTYDRIATEIEFFIEKYLYEKSVKISKGAFLFSCSGETVDEIGKCVLYFDDKEISIGGDIVVFELSSTERLDFEFLSFVFNSFYCQFFKASNSRGEIIAHIYEKQLREFRVVFPCIEEQIQISKYLNGVTAQIDTLIEKLKLKIALQKEYRQSLISNVVTGKIRVTEYEK